MIEIMLKMFFHLHHSVICYEASCDFCGSLWRCPAGYTEYMVEIRKSEKAETILSLTEWTDFGEGISPASQEWQTLGYGCFADLSGFADISDVAGLDSIRTRFERSIGNHVEDVFSFAPSCYSL